VIKKKPKDQEKEEEVFLYILTDVFSRNYSPQVQVHHSMSSSKSR
jgi:hypothetical protein